MDKVITIFIYIILGIAILIFLGAWITMMAWNYCVGHWELMATLPVMPYWVAFCLNILAGVVRSWSYNQNKA